MRQLVVPCPQRGPRGPPGADPSQQRVALGQGARVLAAVGRPCRPQGRHQLVHVGAAQRGRAFDQLQAIGQEHAHERPEGDVQDALHAGAVGAHALRRLGRAGGRAEADGELVGLVFVEQLDRDARGVGSEAHQLALVAGSGRAAGAAVVDGLEQVALARSVGPVDDAQGAAEGGLRARVAAKVAHLHGQDTRRHGLTRSGGSA